VHLEIQKPINKRGGFMPIYEYKCCKCGYVFEQLSMRKTDEEIVKCPSCGETETEKVLSMFSSGKVGLFSNAGSSPSSCGSRGGFS